MGSQRLAAVTITWVADPSPSQLGGLVEEAAELERRRAGGVGTG